MSTTLLTRLAFAILAVATVGAFFAAQWLKQSPAAVQGIERTRAFSPDRNGVRDRAEIAFVLRDSEDIDVAIVNDDGDVVRRLAESVPVRAYRRATFTWDGRDDDGRLVPAGDYRARVVLAREGRTAEIPATITLDLSRPRAEIVSVTPATLPARGPRAVRIRFRGQVRAAGAQLFIYRVTRGTPVQVGTLRAARGERVADWNGRVGDRPAPAGRYVFGVPGAEIPGPAGEGALRRAVEEYLRTLETIEQMLVLRTDPGQAQPLAIAIDRARLAEIAGTIGGDDTILVICRSATAAAAIADRFRAMR